MKYYAWTNTKINKLMNIIENGKWKQVSMIMYYILKINGYIVLKHNRIPKMIPKSRTQKKKKYIKIDQF